MDNRKAIGLAMLALVAGACGNQETGSSGVGNVSLSDNTSAAPPVTNEIAASAIPSGQDYVNMAGAGDLYEIESARLAGEKAQRPDVRELAGMILADHQRSTAALARAAAEARPPLSAQPVMTAEQQANLDGLRSASGATFDTEYLRQQIAAHEQALALVERYARDGEVAQLREHAGTVAVPIRRHLERARQLDAPSAG